MQCTSCGKQILDTVKFCPYCGAVQSAGTADSQIPAQYPQQPAPVSRKPKKTPWVPIGIALAVLAAVAVLAIVFIPKLLNQDDAAGNDGTSLQSTDPTQTAQSTEPSAPDMQSMQAQDETQPPESAPETISEPATESTAEPTEPTSDTPKFSNGAVNTYFVTYENTYFGLRFKGTRDMAIMDHAMIMDFFAQFREELGDDTPEYMKYANYDLMIVDKSGNSLLLSYNRGVTSSISLAEYVRTIYVELTTYYDLYGYDGITVAEPEEVTFCGFDAYVLRYSFEDPYYCSDTYYFYANDARISMDVDYYVGQEEAVAELLACFSRIEE